MREASCEYLEISTLHIDNRDVTCDVIEYSDKNQLTEIKINSRKNLREFLRCVERARNGFYSTLCFFAPPITFINALEENEKKRFQVCV